MQIESTAVRMDQAEKMGARPRFGHVVEWRAEPVVDPACLEMSLGWGMMVEGHSEVDGSE